MRVRHLATNPFTQILFSTALLLSSFAHAKYDIARSDFKENTYVGPVILNESRLGDWNYADTDADKEFLMKHQKTNLFSTRIDLSKMGVEAFVVPDVNYPILLNKDVQGNLIKDENGHYTFSNSKDSMGLNLIPVGSAAPVFRITDENRAKFQEHMRDPNTGRELGRTVDEETFDRITQEIAVSRRASAPKLTIRDFDDNGEVKGISTQVKEQLTEGGADNFNEAAYNAVTKALRDEIATIPAPGEFDEAWVEEAYPKAIKNSGLKNNLSSEEIDAAVEAQRASLAESYGDAFKTAIYSNMSAALAAKMKDVQLDGHELDSDKLREFAQRFCTREYTVRQEQRECQNYAYYINWAVEQKLARNYAENTLAYAYQNVVGKRRFDENAYWDAVWSHRDLVSEPNPDSVSVKVVDRLVRQTLFPDAGPDDTRHMYAIVGHTAANEAIYKDLKELTSVKVQTSIHHVSAYYGANGYTRRGFLEGGQPNNIYTVTVKGVDQEAVNLNAKIWAKIYYENPEDHYQFSDEYEFDEFENTTLKRVLDFGRAWIDKKWVNQPLNAKFLKYAGEMNFELSAEEKAARKNKPYYEWLLEDSVFGLYCFEGVTNQLNVALNIPLTENYLKRLYGDAEGEKLFKLVNDRWLQVLLNEGIPGERNEETGVFTGEVTNFDLKKLEGILGKLKPLWELKGSLTNASQYTPANPLAPDLDAEGKVLGYEPNTIRDSEYNKVGNSLAWVPQTTGDIVADLIEMYVPFHKTKAIISTGVILNFQTEHERRTGIDKKTYMGFALPIVSEMFRAEFSLVLKALLPDQSVPEAKQKYLADNEEGLKKMLSKPSEEGGRAPTPEQVAAKVAAIMPAIKAGVEASVAIPNADILAAGGDPRYAAWLNFNKAAKAILAVANKTPVAITDAVLAHMQDKKFVKFYTRPGLLQSMVAGSWPTNPHVLLRAVGTVIDEKWTTPKVEGTDLPNYDYRVKEQFVRDFAEQAEQFRNQEVTDAALKAHAARIYDGKVIGLEDGTSSDAERRVRAAARELE